MSGFPSEIGSDRLAQIEELRRKGQLGAITVSDVLALVEIAKAARRLDEHMGCNGGCHVGCPEHDDLRSALARLDSGAVE